MRTMQHNPYLEALGFSDGDDPTTAQVKAAYVKMAQTMHPDRGGDAAKWQLITAAYNAVKNGADWWGKRSDRVWAAEYTKVIGPLTSAYGRDSGNPFGERVRPNYAGNAWSDWVSQEYVRRAREARQAQREANERMNRMREDARQSDEARRSSYGQRTDSGRDNFRRLYGDDRCGVWINGDDHGTGDQMFYNRCTRPNGHPHGHMSRATQARKASNARRRNRGY